MKKTWTKGMDSSEIAEMESQFKLAYYARQRLKEIITEKLSNLDSVETSKDLYNSPSWSLRQADIIGEKRALKEIFNLLD